jgi:PKD repeat protein
LITDVEQPYITGPDTGIQGEPIKFDAGNTNLPGWKISKYYWNFDNGKVAIGKEVDNIFQNPGTYNIQLIVTGEPEPGGISREACVCKNIIITP